jgi:hypothetical protein
MCTPQSLRTIVVTNQTEVPEDVAAEAKTWNEEWMYYPDTHRRKDVQYPGDHRGGMAPFIAHKALTEMGEDYKWMLYGDDGAAGREKWGP